jgi:hypothetical protein
MNHSRTNAATSPPLAGRRLGSVVATSSSSSSSSAAPDPFISKTWFFGGSFAIISVGMLVGVHRVLSQEQIKLDLRSHKAPFAVASQALVGGTLLCFGSFIGCTSLFMIATGITSFSEFGDVMRTSFSKVESLQTTSEVVIREQNTIRGMSETEELDYVNRKYFSGEPRVEDSSATSTKHSK